jgi:hypothetical protein
MDFKRELVSKKHMGGLRLKNRIQLSRSSSIRARESIMQMDLVRVRNSLLPVIIFTIRKIKT